MNLCTHTSLPRSHLSTWSFEFCIITFYLLQVAELVSWIYQLLTRKPIAKMRPWPEIIFPDLLKVLKLVCEISSLLHCLNPKWSRPFEYTSSNVSIIFGEARILRLHALVITHRIPDTDCDLWMVIYESGNRGEASCPREQRASRDSNSRTWTLSTHASPML